MNNKYFYLKINKKRELKSVRYIPVILKNNLMRIKIKID